MVIQETLRLYPPAAFVNREALEDITFKDMMMPKGINIQIPIPILQQHYQRPEKSGSDTIKGEGTRRWKLKHSLDNNASKSNARKCKAIRPAR